MHMVITPPPGGMTRQKMTRGSGSPPLGTDIKMTGMTSDGTYLATVSSDELVVAGGGPASVTASFTTSNQYDGMAAKLVHNGTVVATLTRSGATGTATVSRTLAAGDRLWLTSTSNGGTITTASVDVVPT